MSDLARRADPGFDTMWVTGTPRFVGSWPTTVRGRFCIGGGGTPWMENDSTLLPEDSRHLPSGAASCAA
jgi:hypothetical protein